MTEKKINKGPLKTYWAAYGGLKAVFSSRFFLSSVLITALSYIEWMNNDYSELPISILPDILGFSIGAFAVWLGFGSEDFKEVITKLQTKHGNGYDVSNASFLHLIIVQTLALVYALTFSSVVKNPEIQDLSISIASHSNQTLIFMIGLDFILRFLGFLIFIYSLLLVAAVGMNIFRITIWHRKYLLSRSKRRDLEKKREKNKVMKMGQSSMNDG